MHAHCMLLGHYRTNLLVDLYDQVPLHKSYKVRFLNNHQKFLSNITKKLFKLPNRCFVDMNVKASTDLLNYQLSKESIIVRFNYVDNKLKDKEKEGKKLHQLL